MTAAAHIRSLKRHDRKRRIITLMGGRCQDCGIEDRDHPEIFEFDHARGTKVCNISHLLAGAREPLTRELKKCDLVCVKCHIIRTRERAKPGVTHTR